MIKKIIMKNFESHENSEIEFSGGLNLIIGQSNQGKSSIVRALALVVARLVPNHIGYWVGSVCAIIKPTFCSGIS